jgi:hypothetical protein
MRSLRSFFVLLSVHAFAFAWPFARLIAADAEKVEPQPFFAQIRRLVEAADFLGSKSDPGE